MFSRTLVLAVGTAMLMHANAFAAKLNAACFVKLEEGAEIEGTNTKKRIPIASVSKLLTSHWLIKTHGVDYRFQTQVYVSAVDENQYDIHLKGSRDPYFGAERMHYVISELNKRGIQKIRNLTFDENFKYYWFLDDPDSLGSKNIAVGFYINSQPSPQTVLSQLKKYNSLLSGYGETREKAQEFKIEMVEKPVFEVKNIEFTSAEEFKVPDESQVFNVYSTESANLLKEMNRNSNNHAANQIFEHLGSTAAYTGFISETLGLGQDDVIMLNGSGDRNDTPQGAKYNESSCEAVLKIIVDLHKELVKQKLTLGAVATIVGSNSGTATNIYKNDITNDAVIAKTGTVNPSITLGGVSSTKNGLIFFMYMVNPQGSGSSARQIIRSELTKLIKANGGPQPINGQSFSFFTVDKDSFTEAQALGKMP